MLKKITFSLLFLITQLFYSQCWKEVSNGQVHSLALKLDGTLWSWGYNANGQLGNGTMIDSNIPIQVGTSNDWKKISTGAAHSMAIKNDGTLWMWGWNNKGQVGNNTIINQLTPIQIGMDTNWKEISGGFQNSGAIKNDGTYWGWGLNDGTGVIGLANNGTDILIPTIVGNDTNWKIISYGGQFGLGLKTNGELFSWGIGFDGELGNGAATFSLTPVKVGTATDWKEISTSFFYSMAIKNNGTLWSWGRNIGNIPQQIGIQTDWNKIRCFASSNLALKNNETVWSWGFNLNGQLGHGNTIDLIVPTQIIGENNVISLSSGNRFSSIINLGGFIKTFGKNDLGQLGNGNNIDNYLPAIVNCQTLSLDFISKDLIKIYPNPVTESIFVENLNKNEIKSAKIFDTNGKIVKLFKINSTIFNVSELSSGIYFLTLETKSEIKKFKFIKE